MKDKEDFYIYTFLILNTINFTIFKSSKVTNNYKELFNSFFLYLY